MKADADDAIFYSYCRQESQRAITVMNMYVVAETGEGVGKNVAGQFCSEEDATCSDLAVSSCRSGHLRKITV